MNEAEFEARVYEILNKIFPTILPLRFSLQRSFTIKFGHHNVLVNGEDPSSYANRGIYDILISFEGKPFIMLELKKPDSKITVEDRSQGISYARLTEEVTPITVISSGNDTVILNTFTRQEFEESKFDELGIDKILNAGLKLAAEETAHSILELLEKDFRVVYEVVNKISEDAFQEITGELKDYSRPLVNNFRFERDIEKFQNTLKKSRYVFIAGDPLVGKTNFLYQLFLLGSNAGHAFLYLNATKSLYSVLKKISIFVTKSINTPVSEQQVRNWLILSQGKSRDRRLVVAYDHLKDDCKDAIKEEIEEFTDLFASSKNIILLASDTSNYRALCGIDNGGKLTMFSSRFKKYDFRAMNQKEFFNANKELDKHFSTCIMLGGLYSGEFRSPGAWRLLAIDSYHYRPEWAGYGVVKAVPSCDFLKLVIGEYFLDKQTMQDFMRLTKVYVSQILQEDFARDMELMAMSIPVLKEEVFEAMDNATKSRLLDSGLVEKTFDSEFQSIYLAKVPELLMRFAIEPLKVGLKILFEADFEHGFDKLIKICKFMPSGEVICAMIIAEYCKEGQDVLVGALFERLRLEMPSIEAAPGKKRLRMYIPGKGNVEFDADGDELGSYMTPPFSYLILAHLVAFAFVTDQEDYYAYNIQCIESIGGLPFQLRPIHPNLIMELQPETLDVPNIGSLVNPKLGITEPIVQSIQALLFDRCYLVRRLFDHAMATRNYPLIYRTYIAAKHSAFIHGEERSAARDYIIDSYIRIRPKLVAISEEPSGADRNTLRRKEKEIKKHLSRYADLLEMIT